MTKLLRIVPRLAVRDLTRAIDFYRDRLGFKLAASWPEPEPSFAILELDGVVLQLYRPESASKSADTIVNLEVSDARAVHRALVSQVPIEWGFEVYWYGRREFAVRDPDGHLVIVTEETSDPPTAEDA